MALTKKRIVRFARRMTEYSQDGQVKPGVSKPACIEKVPIEILGVIFKMLYPRDLASIMRMSKKFHEIGRAPLYESVLLEVHCDDKVSIADLKRFSNAGSRNLQLVKELEIVPCGSPSGKEDIPSAFNLFQAELWPGHDGDPGNGWTNFNKEVVTIARRTPSLKAFRCYHPCAISQESLVKLITACQDLESLYVLANHQCQWLTFGDSLGLQRLKSFGTGGAYCGCGNLENQVGEAIGQCIETLTELNLGQETVLEQALSEGYGMKLVRDILETPLDTYLEKVVGGEKISELKTLRVNLFNLRLTLHGIFDFHKLTSLTLENCHGSKRFLRGLIDNEGRSIPSLQEFRFRHELVTPQMAGELEAYLCSFAGLKVLSLLLDTSSSSMDDDARLPNHDAILRAHGTTLEVLSWATRSFGLSLSTVPAEKKISGRPSLLESISTHCTYLKELSITVELAHDLIPDHRREVTDDPAFDIFALPSLTTVHIQKAPRTGSLQEGALDPAYANKASATNFLNRILQSRQTIPSLQLVAVGRLTHVDRYLVNDRRIRSNLGPTWPVFFDVQLGKDDFGRTKCTLETLGKYDVRQNRFINENVNVIRRSYPNTRVFDSCWLK